MFVLILDLVEDFHTVEVRRLHRIFGGLEVFAASEPSPCYYVCRFVMGALIMISSLFGPVDKSKNSAETHRFSGRTLELEIEIDGIYHSLKV